MKKYIFSVFLLIGLIGIPLFGFWKTWYYNDYAQYPKSIRVNTFANMLTYYEYWKKIGEMPTSVGNKRNYTPEWKFRIVNKHDFMYSKAAKKFMPFWMEFWRGKYGIHALAETSSGALASSSVIWDTAAWGCVRLSKDNAQKLYNRADKWTYVLIAYDKSEFADITGDKQTIKTYFNFINSGDYEHAFQMKSNKTYSLQIFIKHYSWLTINIQNITPTNDWWYLVKFISITQKNKQVKNKFFVSGGKIVRSFVVK